jgi:zinc and cadmium transporter
MCVLTLSPCCIDNAFAASVDVVRFTFEGDLLSPTSSNAVDQYQPGKTVLFDGAALQAMITEVAAVAGSSPAFVGMAVTPVTATAADEHHDEHDDHTDDAHDDHAGQADESHDNHDDHAGEHNADAMADGANGHVASVGTFYVDLAFFSDDAGQHDDEHADDETHADKDNTFVVVNNHSDHDQDDEHAGEASHVDHADHSEEQRTHPVQQHYAQALEHSSHGHVTVDNENAALAPDMAMAASVMLGSFKLRNVELLNPTGITTATTNAHDEHDENDDDAESDGDKPTLEQAWLHSMLSMAILSVISLSGAIAMVKGKHFIGCMLTELMALGAGSMLGTAFFLLLPEAQATVGWDVKTGLACLGGAMFACVGEKIAHLYSHDMKAADLDLKSHTHGRSLRHHVEQGDVEECGAAANMNAESAVAANTKDVESGALVSKDSVMTAGEAAGLKPGAILPLAYASIIGDCVCNFVDGALIGAVFLANKNTGWATAVSVFLHEIPQEMGDFGIFIHAGYTPMAALVLNLLVSLSALFGCVLSLTIGPEFEEQIYYLLPIGAGVFIYISFACIVPELMKVRDLAKSVRVFFFLFLGMGIMALMLLMPHEHGGHDEHDH